MAKRRKRKIRIHRKSIFHFSSSSSTRLFLASHISSSIIRVSILCVHSSQCKIDKIITCSYLILLFFAFSSLDFYKFFIFQFEDSILLISFVCFVNTFFTLKKKNENFHSFCLKKLMRNSFEEPNEYLNWLWSFNVIEYIFNSFCSTLQTTMIKILECI